MTSRPRTSDLRDDLLADLRQVTPAATPSPPLHGTATEAAVPVDPPAPSVGVDLHISRQPWSQLRLRTAPGGSGLVLSGGPVRLRLGLSRR